MNLSDTNVPIIGVVTRLTHQKGIHLIKHAAWRTLERGGQFVLLGSAPDPSVQARLPPPPSSISRPGARHVGALCVSAQLAGRTPARVLTVCHYSGVIHLSFDAGIDVVCP